MGSSASVAARLGRSLGYRAARFSQAAASRFFHFVGARWPGSFTVAPPLFLVGGPASGKSVLGGLLGQNPKVLVLSHSGALWAQAYPAVFANSLPGPQTDRRLAPAPAERDAARTRRLQALYWSKLRAAGKQWLADESPWHSFRLPFLNALFPQARFIHLVRRGDAAAQDIEARCREGRLWAQRPRTWELLAEFAQSREPYRDLVGLCHTDFERGLLVWRMALETARADVRASLAPDQYLEIRFEELIAEPGAACRQVAVFTGWAFRKAEWESALRSVLLPAAAPSPASPAMRALAGDLYEELQSA